MNTVIAIRKAFRIERYRRRREEAFAVRSRDILVDKLNASLKPHRELYSKAKSAPSDDDSAQRLASQLSRFLRAPVQYKAGWDESKHPRRPDGKFATIGAASGEKSGTAENDLKEARQPADLQQIHRQYPPANPKGKDTQSQYKSGGEYTKERSQLHERIFEKYIRDVTPSENPTVYMLGGGTASGKSTMVRTGAVTLSDNAAHVDPDAIKSELPEYRAMLDAKDATAAGFAHEESSEVSKQLMSRSLARGFDVVADTTGDSSIESLRAKVASWRQHGHRVSASYATVPTYVAIERSMSRAKRTGRFVSESVTRGIHANVSRIVPQAIAEGLFDDFSLHDNSSGKTVLVATAKGTQLQIHNQSLWDAFVKKGQD